ncbi:hypothetical protein [Sphingomonas sp. Marseille-Q8236]
MSTIKDALLDAEDALADGEPSAGLLERAADMVRRQRAAIHTAYDDLRADDMRIQHRTLRSVLMRLHGVADGEAAFNARLKHILALGLVEDQRGEGERRRTYGLIDVLEIALCLQLQRSYVPPATAVRFVVDNRVHLDKFWSEGPKGRAPRLYVEVDAFAAIGTAGRTAGRGSRGNEVGTISLSRMSHLGVEAVPPSSLMIDTADLQRRVHDQLVREGAREAAGS